jgi:transposase-like protein
LKYVSWRDWKAFIADLKTIYKAATWEEVEASLARLEEVWGGK